MKEEPAALHAADGDGGDGDTDADADGDVPLVRTSAHARVAALQDATGTELVQLQNVQLRQRLGSVLGAGIQVLACGDTVSSPVGDGVVLSQRDGDGMTAVKLQWGAIAYLNRDSVALAFRAGEVRLSLSSCASPSCCDQRRCRNRRRSPSFAPFYRPCRASMVGITTLRVVCVRL
jgi:hypothetical protein